MFASLDLGVFTFARGHFFNFFSDLFLAPEKSRPFASLFHGKGA
jgi:hypothetical protein